MGSLSFGHWLIVLVVALLLFGRGRISETMGDFGKGIRSFRKGLTDDGSESIPPSAQVTEPKRLGGVDADSAARQPE